MSKGTILYIGGFELPDKNAAAQRVIGNAKVLRDLGYEVVFISIDKSLDRNLNLINTETEFDGFTYYRIKYPKTIFEWLKYITDISYVKELNYYSFTHLIAYNLPGLALLRLVKYCKRKNIHLIGDCTEWYEPVGNFLFRLIKGFDVFLRMKIVQPRLNGLILISDYLYNYYSKYGLPIVNIPPLVDLGMEKWVGLPDLSMADLTLIYAGSPGGKNKDRLDKIIKALFNIREIVNKKFIFNIIGLTEQDYRVAYEINCLLNSGNFNVKFRGKIPHKQVIKEVSESHFQIFLRDKNLTNLAGFPTKFVESISAGTPVLTNSTSSIKSFINEGENGYLINTCNEDSLERDLAAALNNSQHKIQIMKEKCKNSRLFHYTNYIVVLEEFFDKLEKSK